jgi:hypothetical protein
VVHDKVGLDGLERRVANDIHHGHVLGVRSADAAVSGRLAWTKCGNQSTVSVETRIAIGGVGGNELIGIALEIQLVVGHKVEQGELVIYAGEPLTGHMQPCLGTLG